MDATPAGHTQSRHCGRDTWCRIATVGLASVLYGWLGIGSPHVLLAQEPSRASQESERGKPVQEGTDTSDINEPESASEQKPEGPRREPRFLPPLLRPKQLTQEEHEEAERLRNLAAKYGTDPTAIVGRLQLSSQYADLPHGARLSDTVARVDLPFRGNWLLRVDTPFHRWLDPESSRREQRPRLGQPIGRTRVARLQHARIRLLYRRRLHISHRIRQLLGQWKVYGRPTHRHWPFSPSMGVLPIRSVSTFGLSRWRSFSSGYLSDSSVRTDQYDLGRPLVEHGAGGLASQLGTEREEQHGFRIRTWPECGGAMGDVSAPRCGDLGKRCRRSL